MFGLVSILLVYQISGFYHYRYAYLGEFDANNTMVQSRLISAVDDHIFQKVKEILDPRTYHRATPLSLKYQESVASAVEVQVTSLADDRLPNASFCDSLKGNDQCNLRSAVAFCVEVKSSCLILLPPDEIVEFNSTLGEISIVSTSNITISGRGSTVSNQVSGSSNACVPVTITMRDSGGKKSV